MCLMFDVLFLTQSFENGRTSPRFTATESKSVLLSVRHQVMQTTARDVVN